MRQTENDIEQVRRYHDTILSSPSTDPTINEQLDQVMRSIQKNIRQFGVDLKGIDQDANANFKAREMSDTELRMIRTIQESLMAQLRNVWEELRDARTTYESRCKSRIQRSLEIAGYSVTDYDIEEALEKGTPIFSKEFADTLSAKLALRDIQDRHDQLLDLEKKIEEIRDMFNEMGMMISLQGETVDKIETAVTMATEDISKADTQLRQASDLRNKWRKRKICLIFIGVIILAIIIAVIVFTVI